jgi:hypothetical protein
MLLPRSVRISAAFPPLLGKAELVFETFYDLFVPCPILQPFINQTCALPAATSTVCHFPNVSHLCLGCSLSSQLLSA